MILALNILYCLLKHGGMIVVITVEDINVTLDSSNKLKLKNTLLCAGCVIGYSMLV